MRGRELTAWILLAILVSALVSGFAVYHYLFPGSFDPVTLKPSETAELNTKLQRVGASPLPIEVQNSGSTEAVPLKPEPYSEAGARREVVFSERELNALLAANTNLADRVAVDLSENLFSVILLLPMEPGMPVVGGKNLRIHAGAELAFANARPVVKLRGVSLMGVPLPNAWLGNLKNVDLVSEFGADPGFWKSFADGVDSLKVREGEFHVRLKE